MKKDNAKSVRISSDVLEIVEAFEGEGFNDKFEKLVLYCFKELPRLKKDVERETNYLEQLSSKVHAKSNMLNTLSIIQRNLEQALTLSEKL